MKYKHNITFVDESNKNPLVERYKERIIKTVEYLVSNNFDFNIDLIVIVKEPTPGENFVNKETNNGYSTMKGGSHVVCFTTEALRRAEHDNGLDLDISIFHELGHIYDLYHTMANKYYKFNPLLGTHSNMQDYVISQGWMFWTEFHAYYFTFKEFYDLHNYPTMLQLVKGLKHLDEEYAKIEPILESKQAEDKERADDFIDLLKEYIYAVAKYMAGAVKGKTKYYKYSKKVTQTQEYKDVYKILNGLISRVSPMFSNTYGKGMVKKLIAIGEYIINMLYIRYNIYPIRHYKKVRLAFYKQD